MTPELSGLEPVVWPDVDVPFDESITAWVTHSPKTHPCSPSPLEPNILLRVGCWKWHVLVLSQSIVRGPESELIVLVRLDTTTAPQNVVFGIHWHCKVEQVQVSVVLVDV